MQGWESPIYEVIVRGGGEMRERRARNLARSLSVHGSGYSQAILPGLEILVFSSLKEKAAESANWSDPDDTDDSGW
jgi:hypothetical protein